MALKVSGLCMLVFVGFIGLTACTRTDRKPEIICDPPAGPTPDAAVLGHLFAEDARSHRTTFGMKPPDSSAVRLLADSVITRRVDDAIDAAFSEKSEKEVDSQRHREKIYTAGGLYAVVDLDQEFCGTDEIFLPIIFFVDSTWRYVGSRSK